MNGSCVLQFFWLFVAQGSLKVLLSWGMLRQIKCPTQWCGRSFGDLLLSLVTGLGRPRGVGGVFLGCLLVAQFGVRKPFELSLGFKSRNWGGWVGCLSNRECR